MSKNKLDYIIENVDILKFSIYGITGIIPGNIFKVDYLPKRYRDLTLFYINKVSHSVGTDGWKTDIEGQMRFTDKFKLDNSLIYNPTIHLSYDKLFRLGYTSTQVKSITEEGIEKANNQKRIRKNTYKSINNKVNDLTYN